MPQSRIPVFVLLTLAIAAAAWLWWSTNNVSPSPIPPSQTIDEVDPVADNSAGAVDETTPTKHDTTTPERTKAGTAAASITTTGALRVTAIRPDKTPAVDVMVYLRRSVPYLPYAAFARGLTDADGVIEFAGVPIGPSSLASDRGDRQKVAVAGGPQEVVFELEAGVAVRGTVRNPEGAPVAGAGVWLQSRDTTWSGGRVVAFTDAAGAFTLEHINPQQSLGAVAPGFAPAELVDLDVVDKSEPPAVVELTLHPGGGQLRGTVVDAKGEPIAGAVVAAGTNPRHLDYHGDRLIEHWTVRTAATDENGFFRIDGLGIGAQPVAIRASGYGLWRSEAQIENGGTTEISPRLELAATLSGTVRDDAGAPIEGASIRVYDRKPRTPFVAGGQIDFDETFGYRAALAGPDGKYEVAGVTPGTVYVFSQRPRKQRRRSGVTLAYTQSELQIAAGEAARWDPVIADGLAIEGIVLFADGFPIPGLFITLTDTKKGGKEHTIVSSRAGVFRFLCLEDSTYQLRVQAPFDAPKGAAQIQSVRVMPNSGRVELKAAYNKPVKKENGIVVGRIEDTAGRIRNPKAATITLHSDEGWFRPGNEIDNGAFRIDRVMPARFRLTLKENDTVLAESDWFELRPAATVDTGVMVTEPAGSAMITLERGAGTESFEPKIYLRRTKLGSSTVVPLGRRTEVLADNLTPGDYKISGYFKGMVSLKGQARIVAGQTTNVKLSLLAGAPIRCKVWWPEGPTKATSRKYRILDKAGAVVHEHDGKLATMPTRPFPLNYTLPPGTFKIEFSTDDGLQGEVGFEVKNTTDEVRLRIDLK